MSFKLPDQIPWLTYQKNNNVIEQTSNSPLTATEPPERWPSIDFNLFGRSLLSIIPWAVNLRDKYLMPTTINRKLTRRARSRVSDASDVTQSPQLKFRPYASKVPWHTGPRGFLSQLFPRYGHYCGPNWSSGKDGGSHVWDRRPIDWLDYCCYCHDIGYDTHDQAKLLEADLAFLECLEKTHGHTKGNKHVAHAYRTMCVQGLRNILIPYRSQLLKVGSGQPLLQFGWLSNIRWKGWSWRPSIKLE